MNPRQRLDQAVLKDNLPGRRRGGRDRGALLLGRSVRPIDRATQRARFKLAEARFFLWHMRQNRVPRPGQGRQFLYFASAFLTAAVSVISILEELAGDTFRPWLRRWRKELTVDDRQRWKSLWRRRGSEVHNAGPRRRRTVRWLGATEQSSTPWTFDDQGGTRADIYETCQEYLTLVTRMLRDFEGYALPRD